MGDGPWSTLYLGLAGKTKTSGSRDRWAGGGMRQMAKGREGRETRIRPQTTSRCFLKGDASQGYATCPPLTTPSPSAQSRRSKGHEADSAYRSAGCKKVKPGTLLLSASWSPAAPRHARAPRPAPRSGGCRCPGTITGGARAHGCHLALRPKDRRHGTRRRHVRAGAMGRWGVAWLVSGQGEV